MKYLKTVILLSSSWLSIIIIDKCINLLLRKYTNSLIRSLKLDVLKINKFLTFGVLDKPCLNRDNDTICLELDCNDGRINYILNLIKKSKRSLDVCIYIMTAEMIGKCILDAHKRGVRVRLIADADMACSSQSVIHDLRYQNVPVRQKFSPYIMHHKFIIVDDEILINGSMNFTMTGIFCNWESVMITTDSQLVQPFCEMFLGLWVDFKPDSSADKEDVPKYSPYRCPKK